jgi:hypothetical protein
MAVTGEQVKAAVAKAGITRIDHHECGICGHMVFYVVNGDQLFFAPACGCSWSPMEPRSWDSAADFINMQSRPDIAAKIAAGFGLTLNR